MMKHLVLRCWWLALVFVAGCFSPEFKDGQIMCGPNQECPPGLECFGNVCRADDPGVDASTTFPLTITLGGNSMGTVTSNPAGINCGTDCIEQFMSGTMVTLTASANTGSTFMGWSGACSGTGACTITVATAINVTANFALDNSLMVVLAGNGSGLVSSNPAGISCGTNCSFQFPPTTMVTLTALPATGSQFDGWSGAGCTGVGTCVVTADAAKMVTATFSLTQSNLTVALAGNGTGSVASNPAGINCGTDCTEAYNYNSMVTLTATPATGSTFSAWSGGACNGSTAATCNVTVTQAATVTATFTLTQHALTVTKAGNGAGTVSSVPAGINCGTDCAENFDYSTMVTLSATPSAGSSFTGWSGGGCSGTASCIVPMTMANAVTATFTLNTYALTVAKAGTGAGTVTSDVAGISCGTDCSQSYNFNTMITLTAAAATGSTFSGWSGGGCTGTGTCTVTLAAATTITATFALTTHTLSVTKAGSGTVTGLGINCGADCNEIVDYNTQVTLTATPAAGFVFDGWSGGGCSGTGTCQVTVTQMTAVNATFTITQHLLTVSKGGTGVGTVTSAPAGINCGTDCNEIYNYNQSVTLTAAPSAGSTFGGWSGGGCSGLALMCTTTVTAAATVTATFTLTTQTLTLVPTGGNGSGNVSSSPAGINCGNGGTDCTEPYNYGAQVTLSASPASGSSFTGWSGTGINCPGTGSCVVDMTAARTVTATFTLGSQSLSVTKLGSGAGTVTSNPAGINCGTSCAGTFTVGSTVVLTAAPAAGSTFTGWSGGGCSGTGTCSTVIPVGGVTVTATFTLSVHTLSVSKNGLGSGLVRSTETTPLINCGSDCSEPVNYGTSITLVATPAANANFTGWSGGGCTGTGTCTVSVTTATTVTATFALIQHTLTVKPDGAGSGVVMSSPAGINCGNDCDEVYNDGQTITLTPVADPGSTFVGWSGDCTTIMANACIVTMNGDKVVTPEFDVASFLLSVGGMPAVGGDVYSNDGLIDCGSDCSEAYSYNSFVSLRAKPRSGYTFTGWTGGGCTGTGDCDITMTMAYSVTANYVLTTHTLNVNRAGTGSGGVTSSPIGINCGADCTEIYNEGTLVQLTATPATGSNFTSWSGCTSIVGTTCNVTMDAAKNVTATFTIQQFSLNLSKSGSTGTGTVSFSPGTLVCGPTCSSAGASYNYNTSVTLTATAAYGSTFTGWSGACSGTGTCMLTMTAIRNVTAVFTAVPANKAFVTAGVFTPGAIGSIAAADSQCQNAASNAGISGTFVAFLSTSTSNVTDRIGTASGWVRTDGKPFANTKADLLNGRLFTPPRITQGATDIGDVQLLTGTTVNGVYSGQGDCGNLTNMVGNVTKGLSQAASSSFYNFGTVGCTTTTQHLLCLQINNQAVVTPAQPSGTIRRAFTRLWPSGGGILDADSKCQSDATAAGLSGTFKALLPTTTATALSRFDTSATAGNWYRVDNMPILPSAAAWASATYFDTPPSVNAKGDTYFANYSNWAGANTFTALSTAADNCSNYTDTLSTGTGRVGTMGMTRINGASPSFLGPNPGSYTQCHFTSISLVCLQQ